METLSKWPEFFPSNCPPTKARDATGIVYRIVWEKKIIPLRKQHFQSQRENQLNRVWDNKDECELCGTSVITKYEDAKTLCINLQKKVPGKRNRGLIVKGTLEPSLGKILHTPDKSLEIDSHHCWWIPLGVDPSPVFEYCEIEGG